MSTVLPLAWPAMVRADGRVFLGLQVQSRSGDVSRDLAHALELALEAAPGSSVQPPGLPGPGPRLQDLLTDEPIEVRAARRLRLLGRGRADPTDEVAASMERANASVVPTARLSSVRVGVLVPDAREDRTCAGCCRTRRTARSTPSPGCPPPGRWASARTPATSGRSARTACWCPCGTRRTTARPRRWRSRPPRCAARLDEALADERPLTVEERRARSGLLSRQLTLNA